MTGRIVVWLVVQVYNDAERIKRLASARYKIGRCYEAVWIYGDRSSSKWGVL